MERTYAIRSLVLALTINAGFIWALNAQLKPHPVKMFQRAAELHVDCLTDEECQALCEAAQDDGADCEDILKSKD